MLFQILALLIFQTFYYWFAVKFNIYDKPNNRSSHKNLTIVGGGVLFPFSVVIWYLCVNVQYSYFILGLLLIAAISFIDDIFHISQYIRFLSHFFAILLLFYQLDLIFSFGVLLLIILVIAIGWLNAYNFMDGINGMMTMYSIVIMITFYLLYLQNRFIDIDLIVTITSALLIFSFFNLRKNAIMFSGDVGSVSLAYIVFFIFLLCFRNYFNINYILFFSVYGIETVVTILERIVRKENIFKPHRTHLYQYLANELKIPHLTVSLIYSFIQLIVNIVVLYIIIPNNYNNSFSFLVILSILLIMYLIVKTKVKILVYRK